MRQTYRFRGRMIPYQNFLQSPEWGGFYVYNEKRFKRPKPLHRGPCPICRIVLDAQDRREVSSVQYQGERFWITRNTNPIVDDHLLIFPHDEHYSKDGLPHRIDLNEADVLLTIDLAMKGFTGMPLQAEGEHPILVKKAEKGHWEDPFGLPWAVYVSPFPGSGRSEPHLHVNCVPAHYIPLPKADAVPWQVCQDAQNGTVISRLSNAGFYALAFQGKNPKAVAQTVIRFHYYMNAWETSYNLFAYPMTLENPNFTDIRIAVACRDEEYAEAADQKLGGLEFLTGVLIPGAKRVDTMNSIQKDLTFVQTTLKENQALDLERKLREAFGMPPVGVAVYPVHRDGSAAQAYKPEVRSNTVFQRLPEISRHWISPSDASLPSGDESWDDLWEEANVLVRLTHASICQSDRRVLLGTKLSQLEKEPYVLGHEAGGYVVDPGPWKDKIRAGAKVVVLPHLTCGNCEPCRSHRQNLCKNMRHLGFDLHGSMVELMSFPFQCILPVDDAFPDDALTLVEPLACILRALFHLKNDLAALSSGKKRKQKNINPFTIYGAGPIGCLVARAVGRFWPNVPVKMVEPNASRRRLVQESEMADVVVEKIPAGEKNHVGFVASSKFQASRDAIQAAVNAGTVMLFSGINTDDIQRDRKRGGTFAETVENIHRREKRIPKIVGSGRTVTLVGSSGYNFDDSARSVHELSLHYDHYRRVQNVILDGLNASDVTYEAPLRLHRHFDSAIEVLLSPYGIEDPVYSTELAETLKVLIKI